MDPVIEEINTNVKDLLMRKYRHEAGKKRKDRELVVDLDEKLEKCRGRKEELERKMSESSKELEELERSMSKIESKKCERVGHDWVYNWYEVERNGENVNVAYCERCMPFNGFRTVLKWESKGKRRRSIIE